MLGFTTPFRRALVAVVAAAAVVGTAAPASASAPVPAAGQVSASAGTRVVNFNSGKCLAIPGGTSAERTQAIQFTCAPDTASKQWHIGFLYTDAYGNRVYRFQNVASGHCLGIAAESTSNGAAVWQEGCSASPFQKWAWDKASRLHNVATGKCMAVPNGWLSDNVGIIQWPCGSGYEQKWSMG